MYLYKLSTGLWTVEPSKQTPCKFKDDATAWESLRKLIPNKFAVLFRRCSVQTLINQHKNYIAKHNAKYTDDIMPDSMYRELWLLETRIIRTY